MMKKTIWLGLVFAVPMMACKVGGTATSTGGGGGGDTPLPEEGAAVVTSVSSGSFAPLAGYEAVPIDGRAQLTRFLDGTTRVDLVASGLGANVPHAAHVHALPCAQLGGGHYKMDPGVAEALETNEIWPSFTSDEDGIGRGSVTAAHLARGDALSVVIHAPAGAKMACADLMVDDGGTYSTAGTVAPFAGAIAADMTITGSATMTVDAGSTTVSMSLTGLDPAATYVSHVHNLPCEVLDAGGHYMIDPLAEILPDDLLALEANELWPEIINTAGSATVSLTKAHSTRYDAQSVVIHRVELDAKPKVACANLVRDAYPAPLSAGAATLLADGSERIPDLTATAELLRRFDGYTVATLDATGLGAGMKYPVHVHNLPCSVNNGGGHYMVDSTVTDAVEDNEMWMTLAADSDGAANGLSFVQHVARAEATSLVIHDPDDGARLACIDLD